MYCHTCRCHVTPAPPRSVWKVLTVGFWLGSMVIAVCFSMLLGLNLVLAPVAIVIGGSIGACARELNDWSCPRCGAVLIEPAREEDMVPLKRWRRRALTHA